MIHIGFHLHAYQPPTQQSAVTKRIFHECYLPIIELLERTPHARISLDIARSLGEQLPADFLPRIRTLCHQRKIELVNTAAYHYLLPLVPRGTIMRQLMLNDSFYRKHFIASHEPLPGVFPPELACSPHIPHYIHTYGHSWMICDDEPSLLYRNYLPEPDRALLNRIPVYEKCKILLRSRFWSEKISSMKEFPHGVSFLRNLLDGHYQWRSAARITGDSYCILACDIETFGHHHRDSIERFLIPFFDECARREQDCILTPLDAIAHHFPAVNAASVIPHGSWSTSHEDLRRGIPHPLWNYPLNNFHSLWNEFIAFVHSTVEAINPHEMPDDLQHLLDTAFYSCSPWQYAHANNAVASWCLPLFKRIARLLGGYPFAYRLSEIHDELETFTRI